MKKAEVYLIPTIIADDGYMHIPEFAIEKSKTLKYFIAERARTTRRYLKKLIPDLDLSKVEVIEMDKHDPTLIIPAFEKLLQQGKEIGIISESGMPAIADPGSIFVAKAHEYNARVVPVTGPSSIMLALAASGFNGQKFSFNGYLPVKDHELKNKISNLIKAVQRDETQIFIETPFRNRRMMDALIKFLPNQLKLCIAYDITGQSEFIKTKTINDWKKSKIVLEKLPCIFLLGK